METPPTGTIFDIRKYSVHDGPGIRTTVFLKGCPLRCWWCHNPESQLPQRELIFRETRCIACRSCLERCPQSAIHWDTTAPVTDSERCDLCGECLEACPTGARDIAGKEMTPAEVMAAVRRDIVFYDESGGGVTFSGGEPMRQPVFLEQLLRACKAEEIHTALDTCGYTPWDALERVQPFVDLFLYDLKLMDDELHRKYTGVSNRVILANLQKLVSAGSRVIVRIPLIPGITDTQENISQIGAFLQSTGGITRVDILPYHNTAVQKYHRLSRDYQLNDARTQSEEQMQCIAQTLISYGLQVKPGG